MAGRRATPYHPSSSRWNRKLIAKVKNLFPLGASVLSSESEERGAGNARDRCANLSRAERKMMHRSGVAVLTPVRVTAKRYSLPFALDV